MTIENFEDLEIWKLAHQLTKQVYEITKIGYFNKDYKFRDQIRASSGSIMDNIAEGFERGGNKEFTQFLFVAKGSSGEMRSQLHRAYLFEYIDKETLDNMIDKSMKLNTKISNMITYLKNSDYKGTKYH